MSNATSAYVFSQVSGGYFCHFARFVRTIEAEINADTTEAE